MLIGLPMIFGSVETTLTLIVVALISPLMTYVIAARKLSGRIKDTDATELWTESRSIREWATARVKELSDHVDELERRLADVENDRNELSDANRRLQREVFSLRDTINEMEQEREVLKRLLKQTQDGRGED